MTILLLRRGREGMKREINVNVLENNLLLEDTNDAIIQQHGHDFICKRNQQPKHVCTLHGNPRKSLTKWYHRGEVRRKERCGDRQVSSVRTRLTFHECVSLLTTHDARQSHKTRQHRVRSIITVNDVIILLPHHTTPHHTTYHH